MKRLFVSAALALLSAVVAAPVLAQAPAFTQVRGKIESVSGATMTVMQNGAPTPIMLTDATRVSVIKPISVAAIQPGSFIGTTNVDRPDGAGTSTEVHVFPPGMRMGEGHYPMPGQAGMMTNGDVTMTVTGAAGQELDIKYSGQGGSGVRHVVIPPGTPIIAITPADRAALKPGAEVGVFAAKDDKGMLSAVAVNLGEDGKPPAM